MQEKLKFCVSFLIVTIAIILAVDSHAGNKALCEEWCKQHAALCDKCSDIATCGGGYNPIATFKVGPDAWHACQGLERNKEACEDWCKAHKPQCEKCVDEIGCGFGYKRIMSFRGEGKDYHACEKTAYKNASEATKAECEDWCKKHKPECIRCDTNIGCGIGYESMKAFGIGSTGDNWFACRKK